jgi:hypothetical protein
MAQAKPKAIVQLIIFLNMITTAFGLCNCEQPEAGLSSLRDHVFAK